MSTEGYLKEEQHKKLAPVWAMFGCLVIIALVAGAVLFAVNFVKSQQQTLKGNQDKVTQTSTPTASIVNNSDTDLFKGFEDNVAASPKASTENSFDSDLKSLNADSDFGSFNDF